jgi:hypothetical protein
MIDWVLLPEGQQWHLQDAAAMHAYNIAALQHASEQSALTDCSTQPPAQLMFDGMMYSAVAMSVG